MTLDVARIRKDFPILSRQVNGRPLIYLDSASTSQKPRQVIDAVSDYYERINANVHRGAYTLADEATTAYEGARSRVASFINASSSAEVVFTRGTTQAINMIAYGWGLNRLTEGDKIVLTVTEHHSNLVPWQIVARHTGAELVHLGITENYHIDTSTIDQVFDEKVKIVAISGMSNVTGAIGPISEIAEAAHRVGAIVVIDGAQSVPHMPTDVQTLGVDFLAFSSHKMLGPTGIGVLWGRLDRLDAMEPTEGGGEMILDVQLHESTWAPVPHKFEAGTPPIAQAVGLSAAVDYLTDIGMDNVRSHEKEITAYALERLAEVPDLTVFGPADVETRGAAVSFSLGDIHAHDLATILDQEGIAVRAGHHCAKPLMREFNVISTARASFYLYNTNEEVDTLVDGLHKARVIFGL